MVHNNHQPKGKNMEDEIKSAAEEMVSLMQSQFGARRKVSEARIRDYFEDLLADWADEFDLLDNEIEDALDMAIESYLEGVGEKQWA